MKFATQRHVAEWTVIWVEEKEGLLLLVVGLRPFERSLVVVDVVVVAVVHDASGGSSLP